MLCEASTPSLLNYSFFQLSPKRIVPWRTVDDRDVLLRYSCWWNPVPNKSVARSPRSRDS